jgi:amino acid permease
MERVPTTFYFWVSRFAGFAGIVLLIIGVVTGLTNHFLKAFPRTYIEMAIAAFVFAVWAVLYELRDQGIKTR